MAAPDDTNILKSIVSYPGFQTAGAVAASGAVSAAGFPGPWYIETQSLNIDYFRVPGGGLSSFDITLSSTDVVYKPILQTHVIAVVTASYSTRVDYASYSTSAFQQPQTFSIEAASAGPNGTSYGTLTASTLGAMGKILTDQPYYNRQAYTNPTLQPIINKNITGATFNAHYTNTPGASGASATTVTYAVEPFLPRYEMWLVQNYNAGALVSDWEPKLFTSNMMYWIPGQFSLTKESLSAIINYISAIGNRITSQQLYANPANVNGVYVLQDEGFAEYATTRHSY
tara:strand:+ start:16074 stop:16928 length:855 start_codon:yes stop_codon:yes gene_type:complete